MELAEARVGINGCDVLLDAPLAAVGLRAPRWRTRHWRILLLRLSKDTAQEGVAMNIKTILQAIPSTEPASFREFCNALGSDCPERGEREDWAELFDCIREAEGNVLIEVERSGNSIETLILTEAGAATVRGMQ